MFDPLSKIKGPGSVGGPWGLRAPGAPVSVWNPHKGECVATTQSCVATQHTSVWPQHISVRFQHNSILPTANCGVCKFRKNVEFGLNGVARPRIGLKLTYVKATPLRNALEASPRPFGAPGGSRAQKRACALFSALYRFVGPNSRFVDHLGSRPTYSGWDLAA